VATSFKWKSWVWFYECEQLVLTSLKLDVEYSMWLIASEFTSGHRERAEQWWCSETAVTERQVDSKILCSYRQWDHNCSKTRQALCSLYPCHCAVQFIRDRNSILIFFDPTLYKMFKWTQPIKILNTFTSNEDTCKLIGVKIVKTHQIFCCVTGPWYVPSLWCSRHPTNVLTRHF
jgi:hypothetical protein